MFSNQYTTCCVNYAVCSFQWCEENRTWSESLNILCSGKPRAANLGLDKLWNWSAFRECLLCIFPSIALNSSRPICSPAIFARCNLSTRSRGIFDRFMFYDPSSEITPSRMWSHMGRKGDFIEREKRPIDGLKGGFHRSDTIKWPRRSALTCLGCPFNYIPEICWICIAIGYALKKVPWPIKLVVLYTHASLDHSTSTGCIYFMRLLLWPYDIWDTDTHIYRTGWPTGRVWETGSDANLLWASRGVPYKSTVEKCHTNLLWRADVSL